MSFLLYFKENVFLIITTSDDKTFIDDIRFKLKKKILLIQMEFTEKKNYFQ